MMLGLAVAVPVREGEGQEEDEVCVVMLGLAVSEREGEVGAGVAVLVGDVDTEGVEDAGGVGEGAGLPVMDLVGRGADREEVGLREPAGHGVRVEVGVEDAQSGSTNASRATGRSMAGMSTAPSLVLAAEAAAPTATAQLSIAMHMKIRYAAGAGRTGRLWTWRATFPLGFPAESVPNACWLVTRLVVSMLFLNERREAGCLCGEPTGGRHTNGGTNWNVCALAGQLVLRLRV